MAKQEKIEIGKVVVLNSGGPPMTVAAVSSGSYECVWISEAGEALQYSFPAVCLTLVPDALADSKMIVNGRSIINEG